MKPIVFRALIVAGMVLWVLFVIWISPARTDALIGPVPAELVRVVDGDTIHVRAKIWLNQVVQESLRIDGMDAPEINEKCQAERTKAREARKALRELLKGKALTLHIIRREKYGRLLAKLEANGVDVAKLMIAAGHAREYHGGKRMGWCQ